MQGAAVLLQEYLQGKEYIVDHVSRDGVHKTTMVWAPCWQSLERHELLNVSFE